MLQMRNTYLPYCIQQVEPGWFVVLNRDYKPLGYSRDEWVDYHEHMVRIKYLTDAKVKQLSYKGSSDKSFIVLYNDGCIPTQSPEHEAAYFKRLSVFLNLKFDENAIKPTKRKLTKKSGMSRNAKICVGSISPRL